MGPIYLGTYFALSECLSESEFRYINILAVSTGFVIFFYNSAQRLAEAAAGQRLGRR